MAVVVLPPTMEQKSRLLMTDVSMWQIIVPTHWNDGEEIDVAIHKAWDRRVRSITGGLTIHKKAKGQWVSPTGKVYEEGMIPVMFAATEEQKERIQAHTCLFYDQEAVMCYKIGTDVVVMSLSEAREKMKCSVMSVEVQVQS
jgi:hypothetical protein